MSLSGLGSVRTVKNCDLGLENALGHSFSLEELKSKTFLGFPGLLRTLRVSEIDQRTSMPCPLRLKTSSIVFRIQLISHVLINHDAAKYFASFGQSNPADVTV